MKTTTQTIRELKGKRPVTSITAYDFTTARLASEAGIDLILVGDSLGTTVLGMPNTVGVTLEMMLHHTTAVTRAQPDSLVITDIPFPEAHRSEEALIDAAARCLQEAGAEGVKIEGGQSMSGRIRRLVDAGIPVLGHIGLLPQKVYQIGRYRKFGKSAEERESLLADAAAVEEAGAFAIVAEMIDADAAREITARTSIPIIGIGAGPHCDGQVLVAYDILGLTPGKVPSFAKTYADLGARMAAAFRDYVDEVQNRRFPS